MFSLFEPAHTQVTCFHCSLTASVISLPHFSPTCLFFLQFQSMARARLQSQLPRAKPASTTSTDEQRDSRRACWGGPCGEPCCRGLGGVRWGSSMPRHLSWPPGTWQCVGSPAARWSWRPSMTTTTAALTGGRSASGRANGSSSWKRPTLTGGRWGCVVRLAEVEPKNMASHTVGSWREVSKFGFQIKTLHPIPWKEQDKWCD